jgi:2-keto-3-deoxy-L-rhamnonate aldolase RhmA
MSYAVDLEGAGQPPMSNRLERPDGVKDRQVGLITADPTPTLLNLLAYGSIDFVVLDAEQTSLTLEQCANVAQCLRATDVTVAVRVPDLDELTLVSFANTGVDEIVLPQVRRVSELEHAVRVTRFPPSGTRPRQASFASAFGQDFSHMPRITVLFETVAAIDRVDEFLASEHFEGGWVGPSDLAADLNVHGRGGAEAVRSATKAVVDALATSGKSIGVPAPSIARAFEVFESGADRSAVYWERELASMIAVFGEARHGEMD